MAQRINEQDIRFFVVVLAVQQETGGNLAEVISNLSNIIRKRKQLRMKIRAMTSEARATSWVLGLLPVIVFSLLYFIRPEYLSPLWTTNPGQIMLGVSCAMIFMALWIIRQMSDFEI